ncbi:MAG: rRNA maturation RNase YbeY [Chlorobiaceae bacterium]|nr:rRNA maturation RNase YbeY [Chlorobiaceae bacterium]
MISVGVFHSHKKIKIHVAGTRCLVRYVLKNEMRHNAEINIIFINDSMMIEMNRKYLHHDYPTDVLCFLLNETKNLLDGEVYINIDQARRQALEYLATYREEYARLIIHGVLHLVGYEDATKKERKRMTALENNYISKIRAKNILL